MNGKPLAAMTGGSRGTRQRGVSLIELMIAMAIGLIMILAVTRVYLANGEGIREAEARAALSDKTRFLYERFNYELRRADFWGRVPADAERLGTVSVDGDCSGEFAFGRDDDAPATRPLGIWASKTQPSDCSLTEPLSGQEFLAVRYAAEPCGTGGCGDGPAIKSFYPYIRFYNGNGSEPEQPVGADGVDDIWHYGGSLYYLSREDDDDSPALRRLLLNHSGSWTNQEVLQGIEGLTYHWFVDSDGDDSQDEVLTTDQLATELMPANMGEVIAVKVEAVLSVKTQASYREGSYTLSDGSVVGGAPGRMYRKITFVVPLAMHDSGGGE